MAESEMSLELDFEIEDFEEENEGESLSSTGSASGTESDIDDGELGELDESGDESKTKSDALQLQAAALAYLHEPEQDLQPQQNYGDARPRGNLDDTRLDPSSTENWCKCGGFCEVLPSFGIGDCICCREVLEVQTEADAHNTLCITQAPSFTPAILDPISLYIAWQHFTERWRRQARSFEARNNEKYRYVAYRQFVRWCWGILGKDIRVQLPACVQSRIKNTYPDGAGHYKGTVLRQLDLD